MSLPLAALPSPAALVDLPTLERNIACMKARARDLGVRLRPHVKTHKCVEIARWQADGGGWTASTLAEATALVDAGLDDVTWAFPLPPHKAEEAVALSGRADLRLLVDHPATAAALAVEARRQGRTVEVLLKVDCGYHRAGVDPESPEAVALARALHTTPGLRFGGVLTHAGHSYHCVDRAGAVAVAEQERSVTVGFAQRLRAAGVPVAVVSVGSTPTAWAADHLDGVTEIRPGNYVFHDRFQAAIGSCAPDDVALTVLASVVGCYPERGAAVLDVGALALSKDPGADHLDPDFGAGALLGVEGRPLPLLRLASLSQEHGLVRGAPEALAALRPGDRVRVVPNHSCLVGPLLGRLHLVRDGRAEAVLSPVLGW